jgi:GR25 family glycosyltransferase involved in LPS biosynthesis/glycosyltransferase involved in cell wall biosynthesis
MAATVSILTPTTSVRISYLPWVWDCINRQTCKTIVEWLIIDGSENASDLIANELALLKPHATVRIRLLDSRDLPNLNVGTLRNKLNKEAIGTVLVNMDDDDFYFESRVQSAVDALKNGKVELALCSEMVMYDQNFRQFFKYLPVFGPNHGVACTHAFTKNYATKNAYGEASTFGEEALFTNSYQNPAVQIPSNKVIIHISHQENTYKKKRENIWQSLLGANSTQVTMRAIGNTFPQVKHEKKHLQKYIDSLSKPQNSPYDIVYLCGCLGMEWSPVDKRIGGSEQAVVECSKKWRAQGYTVAVYANVSGHHVVDNVEYFPYYMLPAHHKFRVVILWRALGAGCVLNKIKLNAQYICMDLHDRFLTDVAFDYMDEISHFFVKSKFHIEVIAKEIKLKHVVRAFEAKAVVIPNGVSDMYFSESLVGQRMQHTPLARDPYRLCYTSCYTRGLDPLLRVFFPTLLGECPRAHLHVYYGMDGVQNEEWKKGMSELIAKTPNVTEYGRCPHDVILEEKRKSTFQLYYTDSTAEIDCISIKESVLVGCIPILTNDLVYAERDGLHLPGKASDVNDLVHAARTIGQWMREGRARSLLPTLQQTHTIIDWTTVAHQWSCVFPVKPNPQLRLKSTVSSWLDDIPKFVINLKRRPHRLEKFRKLCTLDNVQVFEAVDGDTLQDTYLGDWTSLTRTLGNGEMGCLLSHYSLWKRAASGDASHMMIFEDDALFSNHFADRLRACMASIAIASSQVAVLYIGGRFTRDYAMKNATIATDSVRVHDYGASWDGVDMDRTTHAYVISKAHAAHMVAHLESGFDGKTPVDHVLTRELLSRNTPIYNTYPLLCYSPINGESDIR